eukprot:542130_1
MSNWWNSLKSMFGGKKAEPITIKKAKSESTGAIILVMNRRIIGLVCTGTYIGGRSVLTDARCLKRYEWNKKNLAHSGPKFIEPYEDYTLFFCIGIDHIQKGHYITDNKYKNNCNALKTSYYLMRGYFENSKIMQILKKDKFGRTTKIADWTPLDKQTGEIATKFRMIRDFRRAYALGIAEINVKAKPQYKLSSIISPSKTHRYEIMGYSAKTGAFHQWDITGALQKQHSNSKRFSSRNLYYIKGLKTPSGARGGPILEYAKGKINQIGVHLGYGDILLNDDILKAISKVTYSAANSGVKLKDSNNAFMVQFRDRKSVNGYFDNDYGRNYYDGNVEMWLSGFGVILFAFVVMICFVFGAGCGFMVAKKVKVNQDEEDEK